MNLKRIVRYLKRAPSAKSLIEIIIPSKFVNVKTDSDWAGQATTCKSTSGGVVQWRNATLTAWSRTQQTVSLSSAEAEFIRPDDWSCRRNGDETSFARIGS